MTSYGFFFPAVLYCLSLVLSRYLEYRFTGAARQTLPVAACCFSGRKQYIHIHPALGNVFWSLDGISVTNGQLLWKIVL